MTEDCSQKNVRVFVGDTEIPTVDSTAERDQIAVEVQLREDGKADVSRLSDIYFPATWKGENIFEKLPLNEDFAWARGTPERNEVPIHVQARPYGKDGDWKTIHYGWLRQIGSGGDGRLLRMRVDDWWKILDSKPASRSWNQAIGLDDDSPVKVRNIYEYIIGTLRADGYGILPSQDGIGWPHVNTLPSAEPIDPNKIIAQNKTFEPNRDTLADVMNWMIDKIEDGFWYLDYGSGELILQVGKNLNEKVKSTDIGGDITVRKNVAMEDLNPVNTVSVTGQTGASLFGYNIPSVSKSYPVASVRHDELYKRAGNKKKVKRFEVEEFSEFNAAMKAKSLLRDEISSGGDSKMILNGTPSILPGWSISAKPVCDTYIQSSVSPFTYGINRVTHEIPATGTYSTTIEVGIDVTEEDLTVTTKTMGKSVGTEGGGDDILEQPTPGDDTDPIR